jgi:threonine/homoserine/homoserine lactone efflux protein
MDLLATLIGLQITHLLAVISPGPSLLVVARTAAAHARRAGTWVAVGLGLGTLIWSLAALFGLGLLFDLAPWLYAGLKAAGALYLLYLALMLWRGAGRPLSVEAESAHAPAPLGAAASLRLGLLTQLANPKVAVFFGSIFVALLPAEPSAGVQAAVIAIVVANEVGWYGFVAQAFAAPRVRRGYARAKTWIDRATGTFLGLLGLRLGLGGL